MQTALLPTRQLPVPDATLETALFRRLLTICLGYSFVACVAASMLISFGFETASSQSPVSYKCFIFFATVPILCLADVLVLRFQFRPIRDYLLDAPADKSNLAIAQVALRRARNFPALTVFRVMCFHGPLALSLITGLHLWVGNPYFGTAYGAFDLVMIWCTLLVIVPAHALVEFFAVQNVMHTAIPLLCIVPAAEKQDIWTVGIRRKLLAASIFISLVPLVVLGFTVALKLYYALGLPAEVGDRLRLGPIVTWMISLTIFSTAITLTIAILLARHIGRLTEDLLQGMDRVGAGQFDTRLEPISTDEFGQLYRRFNEMAADLQERYRFQEALGRYVSPLLAEQIRTSGLQLGGTSVHATVLFSDIRGFTNLSEKLKAQEIVELLNRYFGTVGPAIDRNGGWINKFGGDSILAVFGVPVAQSDHAQRAVAAALAMRAALVAFNADQERLGAQELRIGIGLHSGWLVAGNMGSPDRMEYTVIGDAVNIASRLQSLTKTLGVDILVSAEVYQATGKDVIAREMPPAEVQGKSAPLRIYALA